MKLESHLLRSMAFSFATFGPGKRTAGVIDHIRSELDEIAAAATREDRIEEWTDVLILALDGLTREISFGEDEIDMQPVYVRPDPDFVAQKVVGSLQYKQFINETREWPD